MLNDQGLWIYELVRFSWSHFHHLWDAPAVLDSRTDTLPKIIRQHGVEKHGEFELATGKLTPKHPIVAALVAHGGSWGARR